MCFVLLAQENRRPQRQRRPVNYAGMDGLDGDNNGQANGDEYNPNRDPTEPLNNMYIQVEIDMIERGLDGPAPANNNQQRQAPEEKDNGNIDNEMNEILNRIINNVRQSFNNNDFVRFKQLLTQVLNADANRESLLQLFRNSNNNGIGQQQSSNEPIVPPAPNLEREYSIGIISLIILQIQTHLIIIIYKH